MTAFGIRDFKEVTKVKGVRRVGPMVWCSYKRGDQDTDTQKKDQVKPQGEDSTCKAKREALRATTPLTP